MVDVRFHERVEDGLLRFAVILATSGGKWVFCKHRERDTYECPSGHREPGEAIDDTAARELREETGAAAFSLRPLCAYSVARDGAEESYGMLYAAEISAFERELHHEIERILLTDALPTRWTYPRIQPRLIEYARRRGII